jgi:hypothetical protein
MDAARKRQKDLSWTVTPPGNILVKLDRIAEAVWTAIAGSLFNDAIIG